MISTRLNRIIDAHPRHQGNPTRLETFIKSRGIKPAHLARESGYSRQHLLRIRMGRMDPTRRCIKAIAAACRRLSLEPVKVTDLFELEAD
jgi:predicted transcriptional regulator